MSLLLALSFGGGVHRALAQYPVITSFSQNGVLVCSNVTPGALVMVQWASTNGAAWQSDWSSLSALPAGTNGMIQVNVPMFYRVLAITNPPAYMALIPAGSFTMGDTVDNNLWGNAAPVTAYVSAFYMDTNLVSYGQWLTYYNYGSSHGYFFGSGAAKLSGSTNPVDLVTWWDAVAWCNARSQANGLTQAYYTDAGFTLPYTNAQVTTVYVNWAAKGYRLPTEAEWERAARGGLTSKRYPWGNTIAQYQANYSCPYAGGTISYDLGPNYGGPWDTNYVGYVASSTLNTSPVASFPPNLYGLYDMAGNLREWCWDWYGTPLSGGSNPTGPSSGTARVIRGGSWQDECRAVTCAYRSVSYPPTAAWNTLGFRCVRNF